MKKARKISRVVPSLVLSASFVGVVPACALVACGGTETPSDGGADSGQDVLLGVADVGFGVAAVAYCCFDAMSVADVAFADGPADGPSDGADGD